MRVGVFPLLLLSFFTAGVSRAEEVPPTLLEHTQTISPTVEQAPPAESQTLEEEHPRLFSIFPIYTVTDNKTPSPITAHWKWRLFAKNTTDPFTFGWTGAMRP